MCGFIACPIDHTLQELSAGHCAPVSRIAGTWHRNCSGVDITEDLILQSVRQFWHSVSTDFCEDRREKNVGWISDLELLIAFTEKLVFYKALLHEK